MENTIEQKTVEQEFEAYKQATYDLLAELLDTLDTHGITEHEELAVKALRHMGLEAADIKGYFSGDILL